MNQTSLASPKPEARRFLNMPRLLAFSSAGLPSAALLLVVAVYLPHYFAGHIGLSLAAVGAAFSVVRLVDICMDPLFASIMDRSRTRARPVSTLAADFGAVDHGGEFHAVHGRARRFRGLPRGAG